MRRANGAKVTSPGQRPGYCDKYGLSALKGRRALAPFQGAPQSRILETRGVAPGWSPSTLSAPKNFKGESGGWERSWGKVVKSDGVERMWRALAGSNG